MKICIVSPNFPPMAWPCGVADFVNQFSRRLAESGQQVTIVTSNPHARCAAEGVQLQVLAGSWGLGHVRRIGAWIMRHGFNVVDVQYEAAMYGFRWPVMLLPQFAKQPNTRWVLTLHSQALPSRGGRWWRPVQILSYDAAVFNERSFQQNMVKRFPKKTADFHVQPIPTNIVKCESPWLKQLVGKVKAGWREDKFLLLYFGHIAANRGLEDLLTALARLRETGVQPQLALVSGFNPAEYPYHRDLVAMVRHLELQDQVTFTGRLNSEQVSHMFQASDAAVLPFPDGASFRNTSLAAAIEHAVPIVTTATARTDAELLRSEAVRAYAPGDITQLVILLRQWIQSPADCQRIRTDAEQLRGLLGWRTYVQARLEIYGTRRAPEAAA